MWDDSSDASHSAASAIADGGISDLPGQANDPAPSSRSLGEID
jgi:hypothetical protein